MGNPTHRLEGEISRLCIHRQSLSTYAARCFSSLLLFHKIFPQEQLPVCSTCLQSARETVSATNNITKSTIQSSLFKLNTFTQMQESAIKAQYDHHTESYCVLIADPCICVNCTQYDHQDGQWDRQQVQSICDTQRHCGALPCLVWTTLCLLVAII